MYDMTEGTFTNFVGNTEPRGQLGQKKTHHREPAWQAGRLDQQDSHQGLTKVHMQSRIRVESACWDLTG